MPVLQVVLTAKGREAFDRATALKEPWLEHLTAGIRVDDIEAMQRVLAALRVRLNAEDGSDKGS